MKMKTLGTSGIEVTELCLGTMTWGSQNTPEEGWEQIDFARDQGINFMDTAELYPVNPVRKETMGGTETIIGDYFEKNGGREDWVIATKIAGVSPGLGSGMITPDSIDAALERSFARLKTDYVDLYQLHWPNRGSYHFRQNWVYDPSSQPSKAEVQDNMLAVLEKLNALKKDGKIRAFGTSNETAWGTGQWGLVAERAGLAQMDTIQNEYSLLCRLYDTDMSEATAQENITLLAYSCLGCGMLTGKYEGGKTIPDGSRLSINPDLAGRSTEAAWMATEAYLSVARAYELDPTAMAIGWTLTRPFDTIPIIGATSVEQLKHSIDGADIEFTDEILGDIDQIHRMFGQPF